MIIYVGATATFSYTPPLLGGHIEIWAGDDAVEETTYVFYNTVNSPTNLPGNLRFANRAFSLTAYQSNQFVPGMSFNTPLTITIDYLDSDVAGLTEEMLALYAYDTDTGEWTTDGIELFERDTLNNRIVLLVHHVTEFALLEPEEPCSQDELSALLYAGSDQIDLDGNCAYQLDVSEGLYSFFDFWNLSNLVIDGHGATIERLDGATEQGIFAFFYSNNVTVKNLTIRGGKATTGYGLGGAIWFYRSTARVENVRLLDNTARAGGALQVENGESGVEIVNTLFANNTALENGAAIYATGPVTLVNSTLVDVAGNIKQGFLTWHSAAITNTIISGFEVGVLSAGPTTLVDTDYTLFANNGVDTQELGGGLFAGGDHNRSYDDLRFVDPANENFRLKFTSPAIDKGVALGIAADADGLPRPFADGLVDVGAYEFQGEGGPALAIRRYNPLQVLPGLPFLYRFLAQNHGVATATDLIVSDRLPAGVSVEGGSISDGGAVVGNQVQWNLAELPPNAGKVFSYQAQTGQSALNSDYRIYSTSNEDILADGRPQQTLIVTNVVASLDFAPAPDGYRFANFGDTQLDDITEADMIAIFGAAAACKKQNPCVLTTTMRYLRDVWLANLRSGHSAGMTISSQRLYDDATFDPTQLQANAYFTNDLEKKNIRRTISLYSAVQDRTPWNVDELEAQGIRRVAASDPNGVLDRLLADLRQVNATDRYWLLLGKSPTVRGGGWHGVLPYAVQRVNDDDYLIHLYDPNTPNRLGRVVQIQRSTNSWSYIAPSAPDRPLYGYFGDATAGNIYLMSSQWAQSLPKQCDTVCTTQSKARGTKSNLDDFIEFQLDGEGYFLVTRSDGKRVGYHLKNGSPILEISTAVQLPIIGGFGLNIPPGIRILHEPGMTYSVSIASRDTAYGNSESIVRLNVSGPDYVVSITNLKLTMPQIAVNAAGRIIPRQTTGIDAPVDSLSLGLDPERKRVTLAAGPYDSKTPSMAMVVNNPDGADYGFVVSGMEIKPSYAAAMSFDQEAVQLSIENNDPATDLYRVDVERINLDGTINSAGVDTDDRAGIGSVIILDENWTPGEPLVVQPNTTPTLPGQVHYIFFPEILLPPPSDIFFPTISR